MSGPLMTDYLLNTVHSVASWGTDHEPLLQRRGNDGIYVGWKSETRASVHHDHMLASLAEAGVSLNHFVSTPARRTTLQEVFEESLRDFRLDERETEWPAMVFTSYLAPRRTSEWKTRRGEQSHSTCWRRDSCEATGRRVFVWEFIACIR